MKYIPVPLIYGSNQGRSATFSYAQTNQTPAQKASFFVYRVSNYSLATITNELLEATVGDAGAFIDEGKSEVDTAIRSISNDLALDLYAGGTGSRGVVGTYSKTSATVTIVLSNAATVVNFEVNMTLTAQTTDGGTPSTDTVLLTAVNRTTGTLTGTASTGNSALSANWAVASYLSVQGDVGASGSTTTASFLKCTGLSAWLPTTIASNDSFWNVNRFADATRMGGVYFNGANESIEEALIDGSSLVAREGGEPDMGFMGFSSWSALEKELGAKVQYVQVKHDNADIAFKGITVNAPYGPITCMADRNCQVATGPTAFLLEMNTWKLRSLGKSPHILTYGSEGLEGIRVGNADALEIRAGYYANLICNAPGWNSRIALSA